MHLFTKSLKIFLLLFILASPLSAEEFSPEYAKTVLENGAVVISRHIPDSPLVTVQIRVLSGLSNEGEYVGSGISHFLEHLLFKGTKDKGSNQVRKEIKSMGGLTNGATGLDSAEYHITVPVASFSGALNLLTDMVMEPNFTDKDLEAERDVVLKEIKMRNDDPASRRMYLLFSEAYKENAYKHQIIGKEESFLALSREDILRYHAEVYTPDRMVIGIVGGVSNEEALFAAKKALAEYNRKSTWQVEVIEEPRQTEEVISRVPADTSLAYISMGFHTTSLYSEDLYPGDVLNILLGTGTDSRLYKRLVKEKELLHTISSINYTPRYPGLFIITGIADADQVSEAKEEIFNVIEELKNEGVTTSDLERAKRLVISDYLHTHEAAESVVSSTTNSEILAGDPNFFEEYVDKIKEVKEEDVESFIDEYLTSENSTTVILMPRFYSESIIKNEKKPPAAIKRHIKKEKNIFKEKIALIKERFGKFLKKFTKIRKKENLIKEKSITLGNGLRVIAKRRGHIPLVSVTFATAGGLRAEREENNGISDLTALLLLKGTENRTEDEIVPVIESLGGSIGSFSGMNSMGLSMDLMTEDLDSGLEIFEDVIKNPIFPKEELEKEKRITVASIKQGENDIFENGMDHLKKLLYKNHPYGMQILGTQKTVELISREDVVSFYKKRFSPEGAVLTIVGDIEVEETLKKITKSFEGWEAVNEPIEEREVSPILEELHGSISMQKDQALFLVGFLGTDIKDDKKYSLSVISSILSGADGLLFYTIREKGGFAYASGAASIPAVDSGYFVIYAATFEENLGIVQETVSSLLKSLREGEVDPAEIEASKMSLLTQYALSLETNYSVSMTMALDELYGLGYNDYLEYPKRISSVTTKEIVRSASEVFPSGKSAVFIVHSAKSEPLNL